LGLLYPDKNGNFRWNDPLTREEAAQALIALMNIFKKG
jgi:hypothetical protein